MRTSRLRTIAQPRTLNSKFRQNTSWGRSGSYRSLSRSVLSATPLWLGPLTALTFYTALYHFEGSLSKLFLEFQDQGALRTLWAYGPRCSLRATAAYACWIALQMVLYVSLPGPVHMGQETPAGHILDYRTNGLNAWLFTYTLLAVLSWADIIDLSFVAENWSGWFAATNIMGFAVSTMAYVKAKYAPTHPDDVKLTDSATYDYYMGIELNPRIGAHFDLKLFTNGRAGMMSWTLVDISNIAYQYRTHGLIPVPLVLVTALHSIYVLDFFANESWYLKTIDITHDHFGFYLAWGCFTWLPMMYTLQAQYLGRYPTNPSPTYLAISFSLGVIGYLIFRSVNDQKELCRRTKGECLIWGKPAQCLKASYQTSDGVLHDTLLLHSGWWGVSRHCNYTGDLLLSTAMCALVGTTKVLVWFYAIFMLGLLVHRCLRDEERCLAKYGDSWKEYCNKVRWRLIPGIW
ncbi:ergosterol biosynthesis ERG4/ERG24 family protein [Colletotrichum cereale]|nr:ergosterol biosynthesis ERG4/ERG24 family protein [Colletotrichum cereale]